jgi:hypothetical protein
MRGADCRCNRPERKRTQSYEIEAKLLTLVQ